MQTSITGVSDVSAIHRYPVRPPGFAEPLFQTPESRREILEHLAQAPWLWRASEVFSEVRGDSGVFEVSSATGAPGRAAHRREEPVEVEHRRGAPVLVREGGGAHSIHSIVRVLERWREVRQWWDPQRSTDRFLFRVGLSGGAVVDLARERDPGPGSGEWTLVGVVD